MSQLCNYWDLTSNPSCSEAEERALRELENAKGEWYRLKELEDEYARAFQTAHERHQGLLASRDPAEKCVPKSHAGYTAPDAASMQEIV